MQIIGHRGARGIAPENTINALKVGLRLADGVELDVRVTKDEIPVLSHDTAVFDTAGKHWRIKDTDYAQLKKRKPSLTTLEEALSLKYGKSHLFVEIKALEPTAPIVKIIKKHLKQDQLDMAIGSFDFEVLKSIRAQLPEAKLFVNERWSSLRAEQRARQLNTNLINIYQRVLWFGLINRLHRQGIILYTYTLDDPEKARSWAKFGLSGVFTDFPNLYSRKATRSP